MADNRSPDLPPSEYEPEAPAELEQVYPVAELGRAALQDDQANEDADENTDDDLDGEPLDAISLLLRDARRLPPLTSAETLELVRSAQAGDQRALDRLTTGYVRLVVRIARLHKSEGVAVADLVQEGLTEGMEGAVENFKFDKGTQFMTYAWAHIDGQMRHFIADNRQNIRLPVGTQTDLKKLRSKRELFIHQHGRYPSDQELSMLLGFKPETMERLLQAEILNSGEVSLDQPASPESPEDSTESVPSRLSTEGAAVANIMFEEFLQLMKDVLTRNEFTVMKYRLGLEDNISHTLAWIGEELRLTKTRIGQIEDSAIKKLAKASRKRYSDT